MPGREFKAGDRVLSITRSKKDRLGARAARDRRQEACNACLAELLPPLLKKGMSEFEIAHVISHLFFSQGHHGILRMENYGEEVYLGHISIGESGNFPSVFNGPLGLRGVHPAVPHMGSAHVHWEEGMPLSIDNGFMHEGYQTDKTQVYWLGEAPGSIPPAGAGSIGLLHRDPGARRREPQARGASGRPVGASLEWRRRRDSRKGSWGSAGTRSPLSATASGLAIDEYPAVAKGFDLPLEEGTVLAIEPKIGIPGVGMVGVENTFVVTRTGREVPDRGAV